MQGIMLKMLFTEIMKTVYDNYKPMEIGGLYEITDEIDQPIAAIRIFGNSNHSESFGIED